jgi:hypothetical protein
VRILLVNGSMCKGNVALGIDVAQIMEMYRIFQETIEIFPV